MYPLTKGTTQYNFSVLDTSESVLRNGEENEYIYVDDPKDGNASSAEENVEKEEKSKVQRLSKSAGPAMSYMRAMARRLSQEKKENNSRNISDDEESIFSLPWRYVPSNIVEDLEFFKNADNKLQDQIQKTTQLVFVEKDGKAVAQLKAPINSLFPRELGPQQAARWPADIQVIDRRIKHISYVPSEPEAFYKITGLEKTPMVRGEERGGRLVFMYEPRSTFFVRSRVGGIRTGPEQCAVSIDRSSNDSTLVFESRFESGNLAKAIQVGEYEYELWLRYDLYTNKHTQWFYFSVSNTRPNVPYRFSIVNFMKPDSLYNYGMKPCMYSEKDAQQKKIGWRRHGTNIKYYRNNIKYETSKGDRPFYSLTWSTEFTHSGDTVYFSHCFPYTYTDLQDYLLDLSNDPIKSKICKQRVLCRTLAGNLVYLLTITSPSTNPEDIKHKKAVVLTARVHPGESNASWMMKGFLDYLTSNSADAKLLRDTFIFKIVPMLNPDGVIVGNYRCSLAGRDLNRNYKTVLKDAYPTVWHTKQMIRRLLQEREIVAYCDLHGHSRRQNVFIYGCENRHNPERRLRERIFPCMLQKNSPDKFHYEACKFKIQKSKEGTGRVVMWNMGIMNSYTMEATFCGSSLGKKKGYHFTTRDFEEMGYDFCDTLLDYCDPDTTKCANVLYDLEENLKQEIRTKLQQKGVILGENDLSVDDLSQYEFESSDGGSDSSVSDGPPVHLQFQPQRITKKKKKLKSKKERDRLKEGKDTNKKSGDNKDKPAIEDSNQRKPLSGHQTSHAKQEKQNAQVRYIQGSPKGPKSQDDRANNETRSLKSGVSSTRDNADDQQQKRPRKLLETAKCDAEDTQAIANEYLENLTAAYLRKGILQNQQEQAPAHLRYSGNAGKPSGLPISMEGLCPHHEQAFAAQLMAQQLQNMTGGSLLRDSEHFDVEASHYTPSNWLQTGIRGQPKSIRPFEQKNQDEILTRILGMPSGSRQQCAHFYPQVKHSHLGHRRSCRWCKSPRTFNQGMHCVVFDPDLSTMSHQTAVGHYWFVGNSFVRVWKDYLQKQRGLPPKLQQMNMEELMGSGMLSSSASQTERRSSRHHILEVSESQKRQELLQQQQLQIRRPEKSASRQDEKLGGLSSRLRAQIPSATFVNYDTFKISQMNIDKDGKTVEDSVKDEETKEKGMHDSDDEETKREGPDYVQDPHSHRPPRVKSAKAGGEEINSAIQSIKDLRQSLTLSAANTNLSPTAGNYIKKLLKQELKQTDEDIDQITASLQLNIDEKQKQYDELMHLAHAQENSNPTNSTSHHEDSKTRSAPVAPPKDQSNNNKTARSDQSLNSQPVKAKMDKKDVKKPEQMEYINNVKNLKPVANVTNNSESGRLVDAYHLPDSAQHENKQEGFRGGKLDSDNGHGKLNKLTKVESTINGKTELHYSSATDLSQPLVPNGPINGSKGTKKKSNSTTLRSASSSSSREESDPKSWSEKFEKFMEKDKNEPIQRVKSAKNNRQVVETIPTKISLMITHDHDDVRYSGGQFLPLSRTVRGTYNKSAQIQPKRK